MRRQGDRGRGWIVALVLGWSGPGTGWAGEDPPTPATESFELVYMSQSAGADKEGLYRGFSPASPPHFYQFRVTDGTGERAWITPDGHTSGIHRWFALLEEGCFRQAEGAPYEYFGETSDYEAVGSPNPRIRRVHTWWDGEAGELTSEYRNAGEEGDGVIEDDDEPPPATYEVLTAGRYDGLHYHRLWAGEEHPTVISDTEREARFTGRRDALGTVEQGTYTEKVRLSEEFTTDDLLRQAMQNLSAFGGWTDQAWGEHRRGTGGADGPATCALRRLSSDETRILLRQVRYALKVDRARADVAYRVRFTEVFEPDDSPGTEFLHEHVVVCPGAPGPLWISPEDAVLPPPPRNGRVRLDGVKIEILPGALVGQAPEETKGKKAESRGAATEPGKRAPEAPAATDAGPSPRTADASAPCRSGADARSWAGLSASARASGRSSRAGGPSQTAR